MQADAPRGGRHLPGAPPPEVGPPQPDVRPPPPDLGPPQPEVHLPPPEVGPPQPVPSEGRRRTPAPPTPPVPARQTKGRRVREALASPSSARLAVVLREVLDTPPGLR